MKVDVTGKQERVVTDRVYKNGLADGREDRRRRRPPAFDGPEDRGPYRASAEYRRGYLEGYGQPRA